MYVSVTGLKVKSVWQLPRFWWHALRSYRQAQKAPGVRHVSVRHVDGYQHTLTAWDSRADMLKFIRSGAHLLAIRAFRTIASGRTFGFESETLPSWEKAVTLWRDKGRDY